MRAGLDLYYAYPMTPATPVLTELAQRQEKDNILVLELENEISVINAAIGSAMTGAKSMVGTSGGGFDLMTESLSLSGMAEIPLVAYLAQRPGPATGVPTYNGQGDLNIARHAGHGEFPRIVIAPGDPIESQELTSQAFYFSQKFKIPCILVGDKHLGESFYTLMEKATITKSLRAMKLGRHTSYERDPKTGSATEDAEIVKNNVEARIKKSLDIKEEAKKFKQYNVFGNKNSKNVIVSWGSPKGAILDSMNGLDCKFIQILYIDPFPDEIKKELSGKNLILVENSATGQLAKVISENTGLFIEDKNKILRYDGRPFLADELTKEISGEIEKMKDNFEKKLSREWKNIIFNIIFGILTLLFIVLFYNRILLTTFLLISLAVIGLFKWKSRLTFIIFIFGAIAGSIAEIIGTSNGVLTYSIPNISTIPLWLFILWGNTASFLYQTGIELKKLGIKK